MTRSTRIARLRIVPVLAATIALAACSTTARNPFDGPAPGEMPVRADVDNGLTLDVAVYAVRGGSRFRIGNISSLAKGTLTIPRTVVGAGQDVRLQAEPIGSRDRYVTQTLHLSAGARVAWSIVPGMRSSQAWVRR